jgi:hypothetical protein
MKRKPLAFKVHFEEYVALILQVRMEKELAGFVSDGSK